MALLQHQFRSRNKYGNTKTRIDGITFDSQKEAQYYVMLKTMQQPGGPVLFFLRQVPFDLPGNTKYRVDFQVFYTDGRIRFIDVKGFVTKDFKKAKAQVEALYPIKIELE
jgi:hypothetical protein